MIIPIIEDVTDWTLLEISASCLEIKCEQERILGCVGYQDVPFDEWMRQPLPELPSLEDDR